MVVAFVLQNAEIVSAFVVILNQGLQKGVETEVEPSILGYRELLPVKRRFSESEALKFSVILAKNSFCARGSYESDVFVHAGTCSAFRR